MLRRSFTTAAAVLAAVSAIAVAGSSTPNPAAAAPVPAPHPDFDADGYADLAVGTPYDDDPGETDAGSVQVVYGSSQGPSILAGTQYWHQAVAGVTGALASYERFGSALAWGDFDDDGFDDLAIGVETDHIAGVAGGAVNVLYGGASGLSSAGAQLWSSDSAGVGDSAENGDLFGHELAAGDFDGDGFADLAVGVPGEDFSGLSNPGAAEVLYGGAGGLAGAGSQLLTQDTPGLADSAAANEVFGFRMAAGDFDDDGRDDLAVGVPKESFGGLTNAGVVQVVPGSAGGLSGNGDELWHQDVPGVPDLAEAYEHFGAAVATGDFDGDGYSDLAAGQIGTSAYEERTVLWGGSSGLHGGPGSVSGFSPRFGRRYASGDLDGDGFDEFIFADPLHHDSAKIFEGGRACWLFGDSSAPFAAGGCLTQDSPGMVDSRQLLDHFGDSVTAADFDGDGREDLAIGVPDESFGGTTHAGIVQVVFGGASGPTTVGDIVFSQSSMLIGGSPGVEDRFGAALP